MNSVNAPEVQFKYERFFELSPDCMCIAGYDGYFKKVNAAVPKLLGYTMEELYARPINDFVYHEDKEITSAVRSELRRSKPLFNFENRYMKKNGEIVWLSWTSLPVENDQLIFAVAKDITHKKKLETERNLLLSHLTKINNNLKQISYTTSHDLRSPVNNLMGIFSLIDMSKINDAETVGLINILKALTEKLKGTLNNQVDMVTEGDITEKPEDVDLEESLYNVLQSIGSLTETSKAVFHINFSQAPTIRFNKAYMESVFLNLVTNAIKYAKPGCPPVISIHSEMRDNTTNLVFTDNGLGLDMGTVKDKIFGLHQKFHDHVDSKGIGLYLVHHHVTDYGGEIHVDSAINKGTTFTISFKR